MAIGQRLDWALQTVWTQFHAYHVDGVVGDRSCPGTETGRLALPTVKVVLPSPALHHDPTVFTRTRPVTSTISARQASLQLFANLLSLDHPVATTTGSQPATGAWTRGARRSAAAAIDAAAHAEHSLPSSGSRTCFRTLLRVGSNGYSSANTIKTPDSTPII